MRTITKKVHKRRRPEVPYNSNVVLIRGIQDAYGWMGNMSRHPIVFQGELICPRNGKPPLVFFSQQGLYRTSEALFQCLRFSKYPSIQKEIHEQKSPIGAKCKARKHRVFLNRGAKWDEHEDDKYLMVGCLKLKYGQHPELKKQLLATGKKKIIEDCTSRDRESARFWGAVYDEKTGKWIGENVLGEAWMQLRAELRHNSKKNSRAVRTEKNLLEENIPRVDVAPSTAEFIMSTKLTILTDKYHAIEATLAALKEEILAEVLKSSAPANLSTAVTPLHAVPVSQSTAKTKAGGKRGKLPELYYPELSKDAPVTVPDLAKKLNVKNANATSFLRTQVEKGLLKNTKGKYTLTDAGVAFKATLADGSAPVATAPATGRKTKAATKSKGKRNDVSGTLNAILNDGGSYKPKDLAAKSGLKPASVNAWLASAKKKNSINWNKAAGTYAAKSSTPTVKTPAKAKPKAGKAKASKKKA